MNIIFLDCTQNYSYQFSAANTKIELLARGLTLVGNDCVIHNGIFGYKGIAEREEKDLNQIGKVISYPLPKYPNICLFRNLPALIKDLKAIISPDEKNIMVLAAPYIHIYFLYMFIGKKYGYKIVTISHEWLPAIKRKYWIQNVLSYVYSKTFAWGIHAILPISHYIWEKVKHFKKPMLLTPILADYPDSTLSKEKENKFVYCVYVYYNRVITMIIDSYKRYLSFSRNPYRLVLVLSGPETLIERIKKYIVGADLQGHIDIKSSLPYSELYYEYLTASALLIPLDPDSEQDNARFSQKIAEYLSTGTPVISCKVGEIPYYFEDRKNMIFADYTIEGFADSMLWVQNNVSEARSIGNAGFQTGVKFFDYKLFGNKLHEFLQNI